MSSYKVAGVAAAVGLVAVVGAAWALPDQNREEQPVAAPAEPSPGTSVPFWQEGLLHVGETAIETTYRDLQFANGSTLVGNWDRGKWFHVVGSELVVLPTGDTVADPALSADGDTASWVTRLDETTRRVVAWDLRTDTEIDRVELSVQVVCCDQGGELIPHGVDAEGRVFWSTDRTFVWRPGGEPVEVTGASTAIYGDLWPGGLMFQSGEFQDMSVGPTGTFGTVDDDGAFTKLGEVATDQNGTWSPDGQRYVYGNKTGTTLQVADLAGETTFLDLDAFSYEYIDIAAWESTDNVILRAGSADTRTLLRCSASSGECEVAVEGLIVRSRVPDGY